MALGLPSQKRPLSRQVGVLFWRGLLDMLRNPLLTAFHSLGGLLLGLLVGIIFFQGEGVFIIINLLIPGPELFVHWESAGT